MTTTLPRSDAALERPLCATCGRRAPASVGYGALVEAGLADRYASIETPLGPVFVAWNGRGVSWVTPAGDRDDFELRFRVTVGREIQAAAALPEALGRAIARRLDGDRRVRIPLDLRGHTPFEVAVWTKALEIPRGEVRPYGWIAAEIGKPKAVRAVGTALAHNPVPLVVPVPPRGPERRDDRPVLDGRAGREAPDPRRRGPGHAGPGGRGRVRRSLHRLRHDPHRVPPRPAATHGASRPGTG